MQYVLCSLPISCITKTNGHQRTAIQLVQLLASLIICQLAFRRQFFFCHIQPIVLLLVNDECTKILHLFLIKILIKMFLTKRATIYSTVTPPEIILQIFYSTKESSTWRYPRRKSATSIRFLPASCKDSTLTNPSVEAIWKYVFLSVTMLPGFRLCATKTFSVSKIFNASGAASP